MNVKCYPLINELFSIFLSVQTIIALGFYIWLDQPKKERKHGKNLCEVFDDAGYRIGTENLSKLVIQVKFKRRNARSCKE